MDLLQLIQSGGNPQQLILNFLEQSSNPFLNNLFSLAKQGKTQEIENIARNLLQEQGKDFDTEFNQFRKNFKI